MISVMNFGRFIFNCPAYWDASQNALSDAPCCGFATPVETSSLTTTGDSITHCSEKSKGKMQKNQKTFAELSELIRSRPKLYPRRTHGQATHPKAVRDPVPLAALSLGFFDSWKQAAACRCHPSVLPDAGRQGCFAAAPVPCGGCLGLFPETPSMLF